jgi:hypothetical protein
MGSWVILRLGDSKQSIRTARIPLQMEPVLHERMDLPPMSISESRHSLWQAIAVNERIPTVCIPCHAQCLDLTLLAAILVKRIRLLVSARTWVFEAEFQLVQRKSYGILKNSGRSFNMNSWDSQGWYLILLPMRADIVTLGFHTQDTGGLKTRRPKPIDWESGDIELQDIGANDEQVSRHLHTWSRYISSKRTESSSCNFYRSV